MTELIKLERRKCHTAGAICSLMLILWDEMANLHERLAEFPHAGSLGSLWSPKAGRVLSFPGQCNHFHACSGFWFWDIFFKLLLVWSVNVLKSMESFVFIHFEYRLCHPLFLCKKMRTAVQGSSLLPWKLCCVSLPMALLYFPGFGCRFKFSLG